MMRRLSDLWVFLQRGRVTLLTVIALLGITFTVRLLVAQGGSQSGDLRFWLTWTQQLMHGDMHSFYARSQSDYLPGYLYVLWLLGKLSVLLQLPHPASYHSLPTELLFKVPAMLADAATVVLIYTMGRRWSSTPLATLVAALYALNPGVLYNSARWGQVDSVPVFLMLLALVFLLDERVVLCGIALALSILVKPTALVLVPPVLVLLAERRPTTILRFSVAGLLTAVIVFWPFVPPGQNLVRFALQCFTSTSGRYPLLTMDAFNLWAMYQGGIGFTGDSITLLGVSCHSASLVLTALLVVSVSALLLVHVRRTLRIDARAIFPVASVLTLGFFMLLTRMHERHMLPALPLLAITCTIWPRFWLPYVGLSATYWLNLYFSYRLLLVPPQIVLDRYEVLLASALNLGMFGVTCLFLAYCFAGAKSRSDVCSREVFLLWILQRIRRGA